MSRVFSIAPQFSSAAAAAAAPSVVVSLDSYSKCSAAHGDCCAAVTQREKMTGVTAAVFHAECSSTSAFGGFNPQLKYFNGASVRTLVAGAGTASFTTGVDHSRMQQQQQSIILHGSSASPSPNLFQLSVRSSKGSESKTKHQRSSPLSQTSFNSTTSVLLSDPAASHSSARRNYNQVSSADQLTNISTSKFADLSKREFADHGDLLSRGLIKKKKDAASVNKKTMAQSHSAQAAGKRQNIAPVDHIAESPATKEGGRGTKKEQQQKLALLSNSPDEYERMLMNLIDQLQGIRLHALALERWHAPELKNVHRRYQESARNLLHYVAFRSLDIAGLQETLTSLGLSSLDNCEASTIASVNSVISSLRSLLYAAQLDSSRFLDEVPAGSPNGIGMSLSSTRMRTTKDSGPAAESHTEWTSKLSSEMLQCATQELSWPIAQGNNLFSNAQELLGPFSSQRETHIMVTLPSESALDEDTLIQSLIKAGMNVARVNCAHDGPETWIKMIRKVRYFSQLLESPCRVMMDLAGPKLRTGPMRPGPSVLKLRPFKDETGEVTCPATVWIANEGVKPSLASEEEERVANATIPITEEAQRWLKKIAVGDIFKFKDRKGRQRELIVVAKAGAGVWAECNDTSYVETATEFLVVGSRGAKKARLHVGELAEIEPAIVLRAGDTLVLTRENILGTPAVLDKAGNVVAPARIACTLEQVFEAAKADDPIKFDEGKITGRISAVSSSEILVEITNAGDHKGRKLRGEKAINLPQTDLAVCGLTAKDATDLEFVAANADIVALSFVNGPSDIQCLQTELHRIRETQSGSSSSSQNFNGGELESESAFSSSSPQSLGIVLKIETELGFQRLPALLLHGMQTENSVGVMVARGDMAVECGWQRLAEMQDQILITCEAAHVPTIWATQVLEGMAKSGIPSRAEITDAASACRAECVMLNKGPHIMEAVNSLDDILRREACHRRKNHAIMHPLSQFQNYH